MTVKYNYFLADLVRRIDSIDVNSTLSATEFTNEEIKLDGAHIYCTTHNRNAIEQYCVDCDIAACDTCLLRNHRHHNLVDIAEQAKISNKQLQHIMKQTTTMMQLIDQQIDDSNKYDNQSTTDIKNIKEQITQLIDGMINKPIEERTQLFTSLDKIEQQKEKVMMTIRDDQDFNKAAVTSLRSYTDNMLRHGNLFDRFQQVKVIKSRLATINKARIPSFVWSRHENKVSSHDMTVARLSLKTDVMEIEGMSGHVRGSVAGAGSVSDHIVAKIPLLMRHYAAACLEVMGQTVWVVHWAQSSLYAYPVTSPHQPQTLSIQGLADPQDMVRFPPGQSQLVMSDHYRKQLLWIKLEQRDGVWRVTSHMSLGLTYHPLGLGVHDNKLLVCDDDDNDIHVFSTSGEETHRLNMPQGVRPWKAVAQPTSPGFVIMDSHMKHVVLVTEKGEIRHTYRGQEGFNPSHIVCHGHSIYVIDLSNNSVDELTNDGRHVRQLISQQGARKPYRMCVDDAGRLYVGQGAGTKKNEVWLIGTTATSTDTQATFGDRILIQQTNMNLSVTWCD